MARSLFRDKKRSGCLTLFKASMSLGKRRGYSKASTMWAECHRWNSLMEAFQGMVAPSTSSQGDHVHCWIRTLALLCSSLLSMELALLSLGFLAVFGCLAPFWGTTSPSSNPCSFLFFLRFGIGSKPRSVVGGRGRLRGIWDLGMSFDVNPLFLPAMRSLRPFLVFKEISPSSLELVLTWAITSLGEWATEDLSSSPSKSESSTSLSGASSSPSK